MSNERKREFSLADLVPEPLTFRDNVGGGDGTVYDVMRADMLGPTALARLQRLQKRAQSLYHGRVVSLEEAGELEQVADEFIVMLIPNLPEERLATLGFQAKYKLITWWLAEVKADGAAVPSAANPTQRGAPPKRHPQPKRGRRRG